MPLASAKQRPSEAIRCNQMQSEAIRSNQRQSEVIRVNPMPPASALPAQPPEGKAKGAFVDGAPS